MKNILLCFVILLLTSCTHFEITTEIEPIKLTVIGRDVGLVYKLGNITISDTLKKIDKDIIKYIEEHDDYIITLKVKYKDSKSSSTYFYYYIDGIFIKYNTSVVSSDILLANIDNIDGFHLHKIRGEKVMEEDEEVIQEKIEKVKKKVEESGEMNKYKSLENRW